MESVGEYSQAKSVEIRGICGRTFSGKICWSGICGSIISINFKILFFLMDEFKVRSYTKKELALFYFPDASPHTAVNRLMRWINRNAPLLVGLEGLGYCKTARWFTSREVRLIVEHLGEP